MAVYAQVINFDVVHKEQIVGSLKADRKVKGATVQYHLLSDVEVTMVFTVKINSNTHTKFENGKLIHAEAKQVSNRGVFDQHTITQKTKEGYEVTRSDKSYTIAEKDIKWTVTRLYFEEPKGQTQIFSEDNGKLVKISYADGKYHLEAKNSTIYQYKGGKLVKVISSTTGGEITFLRKN